MQSPADCGVSSVPDTLHTVGSAEVKLTVSPESDEATKLNGLDVESRSAGSANVIICDVLFTTAISGSWNTSKVATPSTVAIPLRVDTPPTMAYIFAPALIFGFSIVTRIGVLPGSMSGTEKSGALHATTIDNKTLGFPPIV